jgi:hypothetical protein
VEIAFGGELSRLSFQEVAKGLACYQTGPRAASEKRRTVEVHPRHLLDGCVIAVTVTVCMSHTVISEYGSLVLRNIAAACA